MVGFDSFVLLIMVLVFNKFSILIEWGRMGGVFFFWRGIVVYVGVVN